MSLGELGYLERQGSTAVQIHPLVFGVDRCICYAAVVFHWWGHGAPRRCITGWCAHVAWGAVACFSDRHVAW